MYQWLAWTSPTEQDLVSKLRYLPAIFGLTTVVAIYGVNRIAFSPKAGLIAAGLMAVSPFGVYLSQEARHYTLPMLLISLSLLGLIKIQRDIIEIQQTRFSIWLGWTIVNAIGLYVHYFCILAFIAQIGTLILLMYGQRHKILPQVILPRRQIWLALTLSTGAICLSFIPWLPIISKHFTSADTGWLNSPTYISPIYQTIAGWLVMLIALPVENQLLPIAIIYGLLMLLFGAWISWQVFRGLKKLLSAPRTYFATLTLLSYSIFIILEFFAIAYILGKDITSIPRYNFIYFPSFCALISASLCTGQNLSKTQNRESKTRLRELMIYLVLLTGVISSVFVVNDFAFKKPFLPNQFAQSLDLESSTPLMVILGYRNYQDIALGLSFALALDTQKEPNKSKITYVSDEPTLINNILASVDRPTADKFAFFRQNPGFETVWQKLAELPPPKVSQLNLWVIAPGLRRRDYPQQTNLSSQIQCTIDPKQHYRIGVPYQLYRCKKIE